MKQLNQFYRTISSKTKIVLGRFKKNKASYWRFLLFVLFFIFSAWLMWFTFDYQDGQFVMRSRLWSDFAAHLPLIRSFSLGDNFPPEYPQFANEPIRYHFLFYFLVGWLEQLGVNIAVSLNLLSAIGFAGLLIMIYLLAERFYGLEKKGAILAGILAVTLFLFNSSLTFVDYFQDKNISVESVLGVVQVDQFINFGPWNGDDISAFWNWNIYTNQRHLAFSFALCLLVVWPIIFPKSQKKLLGWKTTLFISFILLLLPFLNLAAYAISISIIGLWLMLNPRLIKIYALPYLLAIIVSIPSFYYFWRLSAGGLGFAPGFLASDKSIWGVLFYWWRNLGLYLLLWPSMFIISYRQLRKWLLVIMLLFLLANLFQLSSDMINNHKLINFFQLGFAVVLGVQLSRFWNRHWILKIVTVLLIIPLTLSGIIDASATIHDRKAFISDPVYSDLGNWLLQNTAPESVFLTTHYLYNPVSLVGRKTYLDYGYFAWSMGYQDRVRRENLPMIFSPSISHEQWCVLLKQEKIDHILISPGKGDLDLDPRLSWLVKMNLPSYQSDDDYLLYSVKEVCSQGNYSL